MTGTWSGWLPIGLDVVRRLGGGPALIGLLAAKREDGGCAYCYCYWDA